MGLQRGVQSKIQQSRSIATDRSHSISSDVLGMQRFLSISYLHFFFQYIFLNFFLPDKFQLFEKLLHFFYSQKKTPLSLDLVKMYSEPRRPFHARSEADLLMEAKANPQQQMICQQRANSDWMLSSEKRLKSPSKLSFEFSNIFTMKYKGSYWKKITYLCIQFFSQLIFTKFMQCFNNFNKVILALEVMSLSMIFRSREGLK